MDWTKRIGELVGQDYFIMKYGPDCDDFIKYLYRDYSGGDPELDSMPEQNDKLFNSYRKPLYDIARFAKAEWVVELGTREGRSADSFVRAVGDKGWVVSFDPNPIEGVIVTYPERWTFHTLTGEDGYEQYGDTINNVDLLYIDTDPHTLSQTRMWLKDYWINVVRPGGFIVMDDCCPQHQEPVKGIKYDGVWQVTDDYGILQALLEFVDENDHRIDYAFAVFNNQCNGFAVIKLKD
jgi:predicted O-methyltransferase YrrM